MSQENDPLKSLSVIDRLEVGPVTVEKRRLKAVYKVFYKDESNTMELIYRFEEDVFDPEEPASFNLACMMAVQPALNYGLFCDQIVLHGLFDRHDQHFIQVMAKNTAREIFVNKILKPNVFLRGAVKEIPPVKQSSYLRAKLIFDTIAKGFSDNSGVIQPVDWAVESGRHAVLSSGGKDSLLSYGLLQEITGDVHPMFVNESGRHWFTALNAYRYSKENNPNTVRVWTNVDRVFNWMLRNLSFVRQDFSKIRSDDYPIRLWTVAIFIFGVLPILKKRRIGRLIIGDEIDTTRRVSHKGITHYDGLYDQSSYFDHAMTRYFQQKGWGVCQFSILRPLSELMIEKVLVKRYSELQSHQVSCHAAHKDKDRVRPCGKCEKCLRIIGMLKALDADPTQCGYSIEQIQKAMTTLGKKTLHQESVGAEQMIFLLNQKGHPIPFPNRKKGAKPRPEVMKLRFDTERSPMDEIPVALRNPLYKIYQAYAEGATQRIGRRWTDFDPLSALSLNMPYPFEKHLNRMHDIQMEKNIKETKKSNCLLGDLTWPEAKKRFRKMDVALLPVGSLEQHGRHLPLDVDAFDAQYLARKVAEACKDPKPLVLPLIPYGVAYHHEDFSGTISISPDTLSKVVYEIGMSVAGHGATKLVIINGHGGNSPALHFAAQMINRDAHIFTCVDTGETSDPDIDALTETPNDVHAGEVETSTTLAIRPEHVNLDEVRKFVPRFSSRYLNFTSKRSVGWYAHTSKISPTGVLGDPTKATFEKGVRIWEVMIKNLVEFVEELKVLSLDEIYQKRY